MNCLSSPDSELEEELVAHLICPPEHEYDITDMIYIASNIHVKFNRANERGDLIRRYLSALRKTQGSVLISDSTFEKIPVSSVYALLLIYILVDVDSSC